MAIEYSMVFRAFQYYFDGPSENKFLTFIKLKCETFSHIKICKN